MTSTIALCSPRPGLVSILQTPSLYFGTCYSLNLSLGPHILFCSLTLKSCKFILFVFPFAPALLPECLHFPIVFPRAHWPGRNSEVPEQRRQMLLQAHLPFPLELASLFQQLLPTPGSLKDILALVITGEQLQLQQKVEKVSLDDRQA